MCKIHTQLKNIQNSKFIKSFQIYLLLQDVFTYDNINQIFSTVKAKLPSCELLELGKLVFNLLP